MTTTSWPFGTDAKQDDPLTARRIPVVSGFNPRWRYVAAYVDTDPNCPFDPPWPFASAERPTEQEARMLTSFLQEHRHYWFNNTGYAREMDARPLDIDSGWNTTVFIKYGTDDWGYRRCSWTRGPTFVPEPPSIADRTLGPLTLEQVMDRRHTLGDTEPMQHWIDWKNTHPDDFPAPK
ncbi:hypothetical protein [Streptomyces nanshensis]|uniref:Uncharacterized protein n=1 Tax=Streptomyces nanshensis TaxID=518642 RepID=A0A1E7LAK0_9ACTN|nr:hypothetical protein [Streptomyces nanshensis]OEV13237.1 hypothetical protein AN218_04465 [Streptomyces nanshensis]